MAPDCSLEAHSNEHFWLVDWGGSMTSPKQGKMGARKTYLEGGISLLERSGTPPLAIWMAKDHSFPWNWVATIWMMASGSGVIEICSVCIFPIGPFGRDLFWAALGVVLWWLSDHSLRHLKLFSKVSFPVNLFSSCQFPLLSSFHIHM